MDHKREWLNARVIALVLDDQFLAGGIEACHPEVTPQHYTLSVSRRMECDAGNYWSIRMANFHVKPVTTALERKRRSGMRDDCDKQQCRGQDG